MSTQLTNNSDWRNEVLQAILAVTQRKLLVVTVFVCVMIICVISVMMTSPFYRSSASIVLLPREKPILDISAQSDTLESSDETARSAQASSLTLPPNPELYETLIRSYDLASSIDARLGKDSIGANVIRSSISVKSSLEGLVTISCEADSGELAARIVGIAIEECEQTSKTIERQLMVQQQQYLGGTITNLRERVSTLTGQIEAYAEQFGVSDPVLATERSQARIRRLDEAQIRLQTKLQGMEVHRTGLDPMVVAIRAELQSVFDEREAISKAFCGNVSEANYSGMLSEWKWLQQELNQAQDLLMSLMAKHDLFVIRAEQPSGNIAIIRAPKAPDAPAGPSKRRTISIGFLAATCLSLLACVIADQIQRATHDVESHDLIIKVRKSISPSSLIRKGELV